MSESIPEPRQFVTSLSLEECVDRAKPHPDIPGERAIHWSHHARIIGSGRNHSYSVAISQGSVRWREYALLLFENAGDETVIMVNPRDSLPESFIYSVAIVVVTFPVFQLIHVLSD